MKYRTKDGRLGYSGTNWKPNRESGYGRFLQHVEKDRDAIEMCQEEKRCTGFLEA